MQRFASLLLILTLFPFQLICSLIPLKALAAPSVFIEEIAWAGSSASTADEWIELANPGENDIAIGGWILKGAGASEKDISIPSDAIIPAHGTYLIANYAETDTKSALATTIQLATTTISLSNSGMMIELLDENGIMIDKAGDAMAPSAGSTNPIATMIRSTETESLSWKTAATSSGFKPDITDFGTPGYCDLCHTTNTSTQNLPVTDTTTTSTIQTTSSVTPATTIATSTSTPQSETPTSLYPYIPIALNEIVSNPSSGSEWIELWIDDDTATTTNRELLLFDGQGKIATIATGTVVTMPPYLIVQLPSAKLNNGGDTLTLKETDGTIIETISIPSLNKNQSFAKNPETDAWEITDTLTPAAENIIYHTPSPVRATPSVAQASTPSVAPTSTSTTTSTGRATQGVAPTPTSTSQPETRVLRATSYALNEIVSNPFSGPEWVELHTTSTATSTDRILKLIDSKSTIKIIPAGTPFTLPNYLVIPLSGSKLTNGGESLSLADASGTAMEMTAIPKLAKGESWIKTPNGTWEITNILTPAAENKSSEKENHVSSSTQVIADPSAESSAEDALDDIFTAAEESNNETAVAVKQATSVKKSDAVSLYDFSDMFNESLNGVRARISGTVASIPKLFGMSHVFILQNEDGRGLIVYLPTQLHVPNFGSTVRIDGTLSITEYGPQFKMKKTDIWMTIATSTPPIPRAVDLLAPGMEDAWSLIHASGTVTNVGTNSITIETEDAITLTISAPAVTGFRTKRLVKGDTVTATGLLNIKKTSPTIIIRSPEDITLIKHAEATITTPETSTTTSKNGIPNWTPFASAGAAIVATGGAKRLKEEMRKRKLRKLMEKAKR